jgi:small-conductance mechanosensitive channel
MPISNSTRRLHATRLVVTTLLVAGGWSPPRVVALTQNETAASSIVASATRADHPATLTYNNRAIIELRATVLGRSPTDRATAANHFLDRLVETDAPLSVSVRSVGGGRMIRVGPRDVFGILPLDVEPLAGETLDGNANLAVSRLQQALDEAVEANTPWRLAIGAAWALAGTVLFVSLLWLLRRLYRRLSMYLVAASGRLVHDLHAEQLVGPSRVAALLQPVMTFVTIVLGLALTYNWLTFVLRRFPYTRPWGESLRGVLLENAKWVGLGLFWAAPGLVTVVIIVLLTRLAVRLSNWFFDAVSQGQINSPWLHADTAPSTRRLVAAVLWLFALALAYPYLPGSGSEAFKGVSVFVGLMISLGSSGIINQMMSGLTLTYARALRVGDYVRIGEIEGTVMHSGALSTKIKTNRQEEVTIPNAIVIAHMTTNYSRYAEAEGVFYTTSVTIGYDVPWRQVQALLLLAAEQTPGVRRQPTPRVIVKALTDFYVEYVLLISPERPEGRLLLLDALHARILDAFNEYGVQMMSPAYESDPHQRKVVPRDQWYAAPAGPAAAAPAASRAAGVGQARAAIESKR